MLSTKRVQMHAHLVEQRQVEIRQRRRILESDVPAALEARASPAGHHDRQVRVIVDVGIAHAAAQQIERVVEQRAVAIGRRLQLLDQIREQRHVVRVDLGELDQLLGIVHVVRHRMMRLGHADVRVGPRAGLARQLERDDARDVGLERQHLQVEHQPDVVFPDRRHAGRPIELRQRRGVALLRTLNAPLDLAHRVEILTDLDAIARAQLAPQPRHVGGHPVEDAAALLELRASPLGAAAVAEQPLEDDARIGLGRQRRRRRRPRQVVLIGAGVAVVAVADLRDEVGADLERRNLRVAADGSRRDLIDRRAQLVVAALGPLGARAAQERAVGRGVIAGRVGVAQLEVRHHGDVIERPASAPSSDGDSSVRRPCVAGVHAAAFMPMGM